MSNLEPHFGGAEQRLSTLQKLTAALARARTYAEIASVIIDEALPALRAEVGVVALLADDGLSLRNIGFKGVNEDTQAEWQSYPVSSQVPVAEAARRSEPVVVRSLAERNARYPVLASIHGLEHGGPVVALPLKVDGATRGVLAFCWAFALELRDADLTFLATLADQCAFATERARLYELAERELAERKASEQRLREAGARKDEFLAMLAHELRNPLAPIRAAVDLLDAAEPSSISNARAVITRQTEHLTRLVDDLLDAARAVQGKLTLKLAPVDLVDVVRSTVLDQAERFAMAGLSLDVRVPPQPLWVRADEARLSQALGNLLQNARKYSTGPGRVQVLLQPPSNGRATITVRDEGRGIARELLPRVFEPFTQGDRSLARTEGGLGLGLSLVRAVALLHGGEAVARSEGVGTGATFEITFPIVAVEPEETPKLDSMRLGQVRRRVLVVEDNVDAAEMIGLLLDTFGHEVKLAHRGRDALALLDDWNAEVVLSDIGLPDVDGFTLAKQIRARGNPTFRPLLVAVSGYGQESDRARAREAGFDLYLTKPVDSRALARLLTSA